MKKKKQKDCRAPGKFKRVNMSDWLDWEEARSAEKTRGGWSQRWKRRCQRSSSCRMRSKALTWTLMAKATARRLKQKFQEEKEKYQAKRVRR